LVSFVKLEIEKKENVTIVTFELFY